jgi:mannose-1-phosphate guanylyltransferase
MNALILAGGFGTRLRPLTETTPKSLLPIANRPFLEHQLQLLARHGVHRAILLTGYLADDFAGFLPRARALGVDVTVSTEEEPLGTAGAVRSVLDRLDGTTIVFNGDVLTDLDLGDLVNKHRSSGSVLSIALHHVPDASSYGLVECDEDGRILAFLEKDPVKGAAGGWINAGTYVLEPRALRGIPEATEYSFEYQVFPGLLDADEQMLGYQSRSYWLDIGTRERYLQAHSDIANGRFAASVDGRIVGSSRFDDGTEIEGPCILGHAVVEPGAMIGPETCLAAGSRVGADAKVVRSVVLGGAKIGAGAVVVDSIVGPDFEVPPKAELDSEIVGRVQS